MKKKKVGVKKNVGEKRKKKKVGVNKNWRSRKVQKNSV